MAFAFVRAHPFQGESCFVRQSGGTASCAASCHASARAGASAGATTGLGRRSRGGSRFSFGDDTREFEVVDTPESYFIFFDASGFRREDLKVWVSEGRLFLRASRDNDRVLEKSWTLSKDILQDGVSAKLDSNSELTVLLPKVPGKPKAEFQVPIETEAAAGAPPAEAPAEAQTNAAAGPSNLGDNQGDDMDADGSWVEVADVDVAKAKAKDKAPIGTAVVDIADGQQEPSSSSD